MTSLNRGLPRREIWTSPPNERYLPLRESKTRALERLHGGGAEGRLVMGCAPLADVAGRDLERAAQAFGRVVAVVIPLHPGHRVGLRTIPIRGVNRSDRSGVVEKGLRISDGRLEPEFVTDVGVRPALIGDVDGVDDVVGEFAEVGATIRNLERIEIRDQRDGIGSIGADE